MSEDDQDLGADVNHGASEELLLGGEPSRGPLLWFLVLAIPAALGLLISFNSVTSSPDEVEISVQDRQAATQRRIDQPRRTSGGNLRFLAERRNAMRLRNDVRVFCPTEALQGALYSPKIDETLKGSDRPFRFVDRLKYYTDDDVPDRINMMLDRRGRIESVWCG